MAPSRVDFKLPPRPDGTFGKLPSDVVDYIRALEGAVAQMGEALKAHGVKVERLAEELRESKRQAAPFRKKKGKKKKRKKPGRKGGHTQERRQEPTTVDETDEAPHQERCSCGGCVKTVEVYEQIQDDVEPRVVTRKLRVHVGHCDSCGKTYEGRSPFQTSTARGNANHQIGPTALALAASLHFGQGVPYDKVQEHLKHLGLSLTTSTLVRAMERIGGRLEATFQELMEAVLAQEVLYIDETGWYVDGEPFYLWVITGKDATIYFVRQTRGSDEVADFLEDFRGVFVSDGAKAYDKLGKKLARALCLLHLRRNVRALEEQQTKGAVRYPRAVIDWLDATIELVGRRGQLKPSTYKRKARRLERDFDALLKSRGINDGNVKLRKRLETWQDAILRCLRDARVPATNNHAEREIRPAVPVRKRGGSNRSEKGARTFERIASVLRSCRLKGVDAVQWLVAFLRQPSPRAAFPIQGVAVDNAPGEPRGLLSCPLPVAG